MGGFSSERRQNSKNTTSDMQTLDVRQLHRDGLLTPGKWFLWQRLRNGKEIGSLLVRTQADSVVLIYSNRSHGGEWQRLEYPVLLEWTDCNLGGQRPWFRCPIQGCGRRVAILFSGAVYACRYCHQLTYESQLERDGDRAARRADTIRRQLGWDVGIFNPDGGKPKGMHWRTFWQLKLKHDHFVKISLADMAEQLALPGHGFARFQNSSLGDQ